MSRVNGRSHKCEHSRAVGYPRVVIFVSLRMAASAEAPSSPMRLPPILQAKKWQDGNGERGGVSMGADTKANTWGWQRTPMRSQSSP